MISSPNESWFDTRWPQRIECKGHRISYQVVKIMSFLFLFWVSWFLYNIDLSCPVVMGPIAKIDFCVQRTHKYTALCVIFTLLVSFSISRDNALFPSKAKINVAWNFSNEAAPKGPEEWEKISNNFDFSLWGNLATTQSIFLTFSSETKIMKITHSVHCTVGYFKPKYANNAAIFKLFEDVKIFGIFLL